MQTTTRSYATWEREAGEGKNERADDNLEQLNITSITQSQCEWPLKSGLGALMPSCSPPRPGLTPVRYGYKPEAWLEI